jgi:fructose-specific component phosphotransferase system IIB-like protein
VERVETYRSLWSLLRRVLVLAAPMLVVFATGFSNGASAEGAAEVVIVGDSITADNIDQIGRQLADAGAATVEFEARAARRIADSYEWNGWRSSGLDAIDGVQRRGGQPALWVIELGTNDMFLVADRGWSERVHVAGELIDSVVDAIGEDAAIAWVSVLNRDDAEVSRAFNEALRNRAAADPRMVLIDWQHAAVDHPEWFLDLVHPNEVGAGQLAALYTEAIERQFETRVDTVTASTVAVSAAVGLSRR